ncbi:hypothetical protein Droror1_Dr00014406 [Drosera rotundifolia]
MGTKPSNATILENLRTGTARFEFIPSASTFLGFPFSLSMCSNPRFFARIGASLEREEESGAMKKVERFEVRRITGDGRCMFRALVRGMAANKGMSLTSHEERQDADDLRLAVKEVMCEDERERKQYKEALVAITVEEPLNRYCQRIERADFWGGESELLVLSKLCKQPITVYIPEREHKNSRGSGFIPIAKYGAEYRKGSGRRKARQVVRLLYSGRNHYDLLV